MTTAGIAGNATDDMCLTEFVPTVGGIARMMRAGALTIRRKKPSAIIHGIARVINIVIQRRISVPTSTVGAIRKVVSAFMHRRKIAPINGGVQITPIGIHPIQPATSNGSVEPVCRSMAVIYGVRIIGTVSDVPKNTRLL